VDGYSNPLSGDANLVYKIDKWRRFRNGNGYLVIKKLSIMNHLGFPDLDIIVCFNETIRINSDNLWRID